MKNLHFCLLKSGLLLAIAIAFLNACSNSEVEFDAVEFVDNIAIKEVSSSYPYTGLPYIFIDVVDGSGITNKTDYKYAEVRIWNEAQDGSVLVKCNVKGRGNSTWITPKKPYRLKCVDKISPYSFPEDKNWVLLANHYD